MLKNTRQEFSIKTVPTDDLERLEKTLNDMAKAGWELYTMQEAESNSGIVFNCIFVREIEVLEDDYEIDDITSFKTQMEKLMFSKEKSYDTCLNLQAKIKEKREKIDDIKNFLDTCKDREREFLNEEMSQEMEKLNQLKKQLKKVLSPSNMVSELGEERLAISLSEELSALNNYDEEHNLLAQTVKLREEMTHELGYIIPKVKFSEDRELEENSFEILIHGTPAVRGYAYLNHLMFFKDDLKLKTYPKDSIKTIDVITGKKIVWIKKEDAKDFWAKGIDAGQYITNYLKYYSIRFVNEILNYSDMNRYIDIVNENNSFLIDSILGDLIDVAELKYILCQLIRERVNIKDIIYIFEKINDFLNDSTRESLLDKIRISLNRQISHSYSNENNQIFVWEISEKTLNLLEDHTDDSGDGIVRIDGEKFQKFVNSLVKIMAKEENVILLAPQHLRRILFALISEIYMDVPIICPEEISNDYELVILGEI